MAAEHTAFTTSGEDAIRRTIDVEVDTTADRLSPAEFDNFYEIDRTAEEIIKGDYKRVRIIPSIPSLRLIIEHFLFSDSSPVSRRTVTRLRADL